jgi:uncharacterized membrane protein YedE/YeeE
MRNQVIMTSFAFGLIFGAGLVISGMADPNLVKAFLDIAGAWNPALALVMGGAILIAAPCFWLARRRERSLIGLPINLPDAQRIDAKLLTGAALFGIGWGLSGICPGPSLVLLGYGARGAFVFVLALIIGAQIAARLGKTAKPDG